MRDRFRTPIPRALVEWFELVGRRLRAVQDSPLRLDELTIEGGVMRVWIENQGVWSIVAPVEAGDDPLCRADGEPTSSPDAPLSRTLLGMVVSDTLAGVGRRVGPLGELGATVQGGCCDEFSNKQLQRLRSTFQPLSYSLNPFFEEPYRGDDATVVRIQEVALEWMTATNPAFAAERARRSATGRGREARARRVRDRRGAAARPTA